jgi:hypothetical protein
MGHKFAEQCFSLYEVIKKCLSEWFSAWGDDFYWHDIHKLPKTWEKYTLE